MNDRDRLRQAFEETFEMRADPGVRQRVIARAVAHQAAPARVSRALMFAGGLAAAVIVIGAVVALLHMPAGGAPTPAGHPTPSASPAASTPTSAELEAVTNSVYRLDTRYHYYVSCDATGSQANCPYTARLKAQLSALRTTACLGCQNPFQSLSATAVPDQGGGIVMVTAGGFEYDLHIVTVNGALLVDDIVWACSGGANGVDVYRMHLTGTPGQGPIGVQPAPSCPA